MSLPGFRSTVQASFCFSKGALKVINEEFLVLRLYSPTHVTEVVSQQGVAAIAVQFVPPQFSSVCATP